MKKKQIRFHIYLSEEPSKFETTKERVEEVAKFLGVSMNKAIAYAVNNLYSQINERRLTIRDSELETNFLFAGLPEEKKEAIRKAATPEEKRALLAQAVEELIL